MLQTLNLWKRVRRQAKRDRQLSFGIVHKEVRVGEIE